jgi:hypothetical protein
MKLKTKIIHHFDIDPDLLKNLDFVFPLHPKKIIKEKIKIIEIKKKNKIKHDASTRLF